jgi:hypothetical protein
MRNIEIYFTTVISGLRFLATLSAGAGVGGQLASAWLWR